MTAAFAHHTFPIERFENRDTGQVVYVPFGQTFVDDEKMLVRDGLLHIEHDEDGHIRAVFVLAPLDPRILCWKLSQNHLARRRGQPDVWTDLPVNVYEEISGAAH